MGDSSKMAVLTAAKSAFEALASHFTANGVTATEAEALLRAVCVHEAARPFTESGRRPNVSQISIKTGIERHVVADLLKLPLRVGGVSDARPTATIRVISGWRSDRRYLNNGRPRPLPVGDPRTRGRSVWKLVETYAPGVWPRLVIDELLRVDLVDVLSNGTLRCKSQSKSSFSGPKLPVDRAYPQLLRDALSSYLADVSELGLSQGSWRATLGVEINEDSAPLVRRVVRERLDNAIAELADELHSIRWHPGPNDQDPKVQIRINAFAFEPRSLGSDTRKSAKAGRRRYRPARSPR
jgi:hypothetical protein